MRGVDAITPAVVLSALPLGEHYGLAMPRLASLVARIADSGRTGSDIERHVRRVIEALRRQGVPICGRPGHGYYLASTDAELLDTCEFLYSRAMTTLTQVSAMRRVSLPDLRGQLRLPPKETS